MARRGVSPGVTLRAPTRRECRRHLRRGKSGDGKDASPDGVARQCRAADRGGARVPGRRRGPRASMRVAFWPTSWEDRRHWQDHDVKIAENLTGLIEECRRHPFKGTSKPEPLGGNLSGWCRGRSARSIGWSTRSRHAPTGSAVSAGAFLIRPPVFRILGTREHRRWTLRGSPA